MLALTLCLCLAVGSASEERSGPVFLIAGQRELLLASEALCRRRAAQGLVVERYELAPSGEAPAAALALRRHVHERIAASPLPGYLLLVGDSELGGFPLPSLRRPGLPTYREGSPGAVEVWSDLGYVDPDDDGAPEWSCGRLPVRDAAALRSVIDKILAYEDPLAPALERGSWQRELGMIATSGNFGALLDGAIEGAIAKLFREELDTRYELHQVVGLESSPYYVAPAEFHTAVLALLEEGPLAAIYAGHGQLGRFARFRGQPVLGIEDASQLRHASRTLLMAYACHIGGFPKSCLGEALLAAPGGPCAVFAASEVSFPLGDILLGRELMQELGRAGAELRLGDLIRAAKCRLSAPPDDEFQRWAGAVAVGLGFEPAQRAGLCRYTSDLYHLLGDPAMRLSLPSSLTLEALPPAGPASGPLRIRLSCSSGTQPERVRVELCLDRGAVRDEQGAPATDLLQAVELDWPAASSVLETQFECELPKVRHLALRAFGHTREHTWAGGLRFRVER